MPVARAPMAESFLQLPLQFLKGVGPRKAADLKKAGLLTVEDLLFRFPTRYEDRSRLQPMRQREARSHGGRQRRSSVCQSPIDAPGGLPVVLRARAGRERTDPGGVAQPGVSQGRHPAASADRAVRQGRVLGIARDADHRSRVRDHPRRRPRPTVNAPYRPHRPRVRANGKRDDEHAAQARVGRAGAAAGGSVRSAACRHSVYAKAGRPGAPRSSVRTFPRAARRSTR